jgi:ribose transport system substrate-binding protein
VPQLGYHDQSGVVATLPAEYQKAYNGYADTIYKSAWASYKPKGPGPYTIGVQTTGPIDSFQVQMIAGLQQDLKAVKGVGKVILLTTGPTAVTQQIQQTNQLIQQKVTMIISQPLVPPAAQKEAAVAAKAGIPFISIVDPTQSPDAINLVNNAVNDGLWSGAQIAKLIGGKGTVVGVQGIPSVAVNVQEFQGWEKAFAQCPNIKFTSSLIGEFAAPVAKQQVLTYLTSHPQPVAGAVEAATMTPGIIQAFQQVGRPIPAIADIAPTDGTLSYWLGHQSTYKSAAATIVAQGQASSVAYTVSQMLAGHGPKLSDMVSQSLQITDANLSQFAKPGVPLSDMTSVNPPNVYATDSYLAPFFNK